MKRNDRLKIGLNKKGILLLVLVCLHLPLFAGGQKEAVPAPAMRVGWGVEPDSLSPFVSYTQAGAEVFSLLYDSLVNFDENLVPQGNLASSWSLSSNQLEWTFNLVEGVKWHDGENFTSEDVKFSYELMMESGLGLYSDFLTGITEIECPDENTVIIRTEKPKANMLMITAPIVPEHIWKDVAFEDLELWENEHPIGTGPFSFVQWNSGEFLKLKANSSYFNGKPAIEELIFVLYANNDTMAQALKTGELDAAINMNVNQVKALKKEAGISVISAAAFGFTELSVNASLDPELQGNSNLQDPVVRQALEWALDKQNIIDVAYAGQGIPGTTLVPPDNFWHYEPAAGKKRSFNPEKAKSLLEAAGYRDSNGDGIREDGSGNSLIFNFMLRAKSAEEVKAGQMISGMLKNIGIGTEIETVDDGVLVDRIYAGEFDLFIWGWGTDVDPTTILAVMSTDQIGNLSDCNYSNPVYDEMLLEQSTLMNKTERQKMVWKMQEILYDDAPYIILFYDAAVQAVRTDRWQGWKQIPENGPYFFNLTSINYKNVFPVSGN
ncbi:MAG: ABC transporter substrate-binding protein [Spirochaetales bacterium]|nr:ABC transporter substrate-binding protein [Spirochaetales bacterium]